MPASLLPLDCKLEITFFAGDCNKVIISPINSSFDLRSARVDKFSSPIYKASSK